jgi:DNA-binding NtrC family response regulator
MTRSDAGATPARVLVVDDETIARHLAVEILRRAGYDTLSVNDGAQAIPLLRDRGVDVVVSDLMMPRVGGLELLDWMSKHTPDVELVLITANNDVGTAVQAMRRGAFDYLTKPFVTDQLRNTVQHAVERRRLRLETRELRRRLGETTGVDAIIGASEAIARVRERIRLAADRDVTVLIHGETGTGKELVARAIHQVSRRHAAPFVSVNCAALPETLIGSELFGHERGSFTSADRTRVGRFEAAHGGTLHLDEIGDLPLATQGALLRVLEDQRFERVGSSETLQVDVRVLTATKRNLAEGVQRGQFREDLFFRLNVMTIECPPLRDRLEDIPFLTAHFLARAGQPQRAIEPVAMHKLMSHAWPGNVRELQNVMARAVILAGDAAIAAEDLELGLAAPETASSLELDAVEKRHIQHVLELTGWNRSEAARLLGVDRSTLQRKVARFDLHPPVP